MFAGDSKEIAGSSFLLQNEGANGVLKPGADEMKSRKERTKVPELLIKFKINSFFVPFPVFLRLQSALISDCGNRMRRRFRKSSSLGEENPPAGDGATIPTLTDSNRWRGELPGLP